MRGTQYVFRVAPGTKGLLREKEMINLSIFRDAYKVRA
jgi:hypothetical protein